jgi:hypothetical protein
MARAMVDECEADAGIARPQSPAASKMPLTGLVSGKSREETARWASLRGQARCRRRRCIVYLLALETIRTNPQIADQASRKSQRAFRVTAPELPESSVAAPIGHTSFAQPGEIQIDNQGFARWPAAGRSSQICESCNRRPRNETDR